MLKEDLTHRSYYKNVRSLIMTFNVTIQSHFSTNHLENNCSDEGEFSFLAWQKAFHHMYISNLTLFKYQTEPSIRM